MRRTRIAALLVAGLLMAGCGSSSVASPPATSGSAAQTTASTATSTPIPTPFPVDGASAGFTVDCGPQEDNVACLGVVAAAASGLSPDHPPVTRVTVRTLEPEATPAPSPSPAAADSPAVEIDTFVVAYWVDFSWPGGAEVVPVSQTYAGWLPGLPLAATRIYRVSHAARSWTEPVPFALKAGEYSVGGGCGGSDSTPGGAMIVLERVRDDGTVLVDVHRVRCGPAVGLTAAFGDTVTLDEGLYRLAIEENTGSLEVDLEPVATVN